jgi:hypothetical protein
MNTARWVALIIVAVFIIVLGIKEPNFAISFVIAMALVRIFIWCDKHWYD